MRIYVDRTQLVVSPDKSPHKAIASSLHVKNEKSPEKSQLRKLIAYARVSTRGQGDGESLGQQEHAIRSYALEHGATLHAYHDEVASGRGGYDQRPEFQQVVISARSCGYPIVCTSVDRLGRDEAFLIREIVESGIRVISIAHGHELDMRELRTLARKAERGARRISRDTKRALRSSRQGSSAGASAGGLISAEVRSKAALDFNAAVAGKIEQIEAVHGPHLSLSDLARRLTAAGIETAQGGRRWHAETVKRVLAGSARFISERSPKGEV